MLEKDDLKRILHYNPETGIFTWREKTSNYVKYEVGDTANIVASHGYVQISIYGTHYLAHRLVWLYMFGFMPSKQIDHINMIRTDNRLINLRESSSSQNKCNSGVNSLNTSGIRGVSFEKSRNKWCATVQFEGVVYRLGRFDSKEAAADAYTNAAKKIHREFRHKSNGE